MERSGIAVWCSALLAAFILEVATKHLLDVFGGLFLQFCGFFNDNL
jgi:hypothetical protein